LMVAVASLVLVFAMIACRCGVCAPLIILVFNKWNVY